MSLTKPSDYKGLIAISQNRYDDEKLQLFLDELEGQCLTDLLGCDLYALFVADLVLGVPQSARFLAIYNIISIDVEGFSVGDWYYDYYNFYCSNKQNRSRGMLAMLKGFMFFEYVRIQQQTNSSIGTNKSVGVASELVSPPNTSAITNYNKSILDYWNIQYYIKENSDTYPEFNGLTKESISLI